MRSFIGFETSTFFRTTDKKKRDALHYAVIANNHAFFNHLLLRIDDYYGSGLSYYGLTKEFVFRKKCDPWDARTAFDNVTVDGHTAYDLAVALKRPELAELVLRCRNACMAEAFIHFLHHNLAHTIHDSREEYAYESILYTVEEASELLAQHNVDLSTIDTAPFFICLQHCAFHLASRGELTYLKWLIEAWMLDPTFTASEAPHMNYDIHPFLKHYNTRLSLPVAVTMGPSYSYVTAQLHKKEPTEQALIFNKALNEVFQHQYWKPEMSAKEHIESCVSVYKGSDGYTHSKYKGLILVSRSVSNYEIRYLDMYIDSVVARVDGICVEVRLATLTYLRDDLKLPLPPLLLTVSLGQPHILAWVAIRKDLTKPLASNNNLMRAVKKVDWLSGVDTAIPIASLLCYYAAGLGEIAVMQWLLRRFETARAGCVGGMNLLHIATACDRVPCVIWLTRHYPTLITELTDSGRSVLHLAIQHKHIWLTRFYMGLEYSDTYFESLWEDDSSGHGVYWHLAQSEEPELATWVRLKAQVTALESVIAVLDETPLSSSSLAMLLKDIDFFGITRSLEVGPLSYGYELWRDEYSLNSLDYACGLAAVVALIKKALLMGRWDLLFMIFDDLYHHPSKYNMFVVSVQKKIKSVATAWGIEQAGLDFVAYVFSRYSDGPSTLESDLAVLSSDRAFPALESIHKSELYPMTPLNYAIAYDCEPVVRWILAHPRFDKSARHSVLYSAFKAAVATSQYSYIDMLLNEDFGEDVPYYSMYRACADRKNHHYPLRDNVIRQLLTRQARDQGDKIYKLYTHTLIPFVLGHLFYNVTVENESEIRKSMDLLGWLFAHPSVRHPEPKEAEQLVDCIIHQLSCKLSEFEPAESMSADEVDERVTYLVEL